VNPREDESKDGEYFRVTVECRREADGEAVPVRFTLGERSVSVTDIADRWLARDHRYFKIRTESGSTYILRHDVERDIWEIVLFQASPQAGMR
jgi:hypothetical protein